MHWRTLVDANSRVTKTLVIAITTPMKVKMASFDQVLLDDGLFVGRWPFVAKVASVGRVMRVGEPTARPIAWKQKMYREHRPLKFIVGSSRAS